MTFFLVYDNTKRILSKSSIFYLITFFIKTKETNFNHSVIHLLGAAAAETAGGIVRQNPFSKKKINKN